MCIFFFAAGISAVYWLTPLLLVYIISRDWKKIEEYEVTYSMVQYKSMLLINITERDFRCLKCL